MAWYIAKMYTLKENDPVLWQDFEDWAVSRSKTPLCSLGADEALEQQNRARKVTGRLVGITQNPNALARYFLTAPELQRISSDAIEMIGTSEQINHEKHHLNNVSAYRTQESAIAKIRAEIERVGNPFTYDSSELINIATKAVFAVDVGADVDRVVT